MLDRYQGTRGRRRWRPSLTWVLLHRGNVAMEANRVPVLIEVNSVADQVTLLKKVKSDPQVHLDTSIRKTVKKADNVRTGRGGVYPSSFILA